MEGGGAQRERCGTREVSSGPGVERCAAEVPGPERGERPGGAGPAEEGGEGGDGLLWAWRVRPDLFPLGVVSAGCTAGRICRRTLPGFKTWS